MDVYDEVAYVYDGTPEGLLSAIFAAYARREDPTDVVAEGAVQPRLGQRIARIPTDGARADRVRAGIVRECGQRTFRQVLKASLSSDAGAGTAVYRFVRHAMGCGGARVVDDIAHPAVAGLFALVRGVEGECEKMRQFARFEHRGGPGAGVWVATVNPRDAVVPLVLDHFVERFNVQPFILFDEVHAMAGVWDGAERYLVATGRDDLAAALPGLRAEEGAMQDAWRRFYRAVSIGDRYHPELRRAFMPMRFWSHLTEMRPDVPAMMGPTDR